MQGKPGFEVFTQALSRVNSVDHSVLKHSSSHRYRAFPAPGGQEFGRFLVREASASQPGSDNILRELRVRTAAGPTGVAQVSPKTLTVLPLRVSKTVAREYQRLSVVVGIIKYARQKFLKRNGTHNIPHTLSLAYTDIIE